jgi:hypothetical protein
MTWKSATARLFLVRGEQDAIAHEASLPAFGQILIASELRKLGFSISPAGVRSIEARSSLRDLESLFLTEMRDLLSNAFRWFGSECLAGRRDHCFATALRWSERAAADCEKLQWLASVCSERASATACISRQVSNST